MTEQRSLPAGDETGAPKDSWRVSLTGGSADPLLDHLQNRSPLRLVLVWLGIVAFGATAEATALTHLDELVDALRERLGGTRGLVLRYHDGTEGSDGRHFFYATATHEAVAVGLPLPAPVFQREPSSFVAGSADILAGRCVDVAAAPLSRLLRGRRRPRDLREPAVDGGRRLAGDNAAARRRSGCGSWRESSDDGVAPRTRDRHCRFPGRPWWAVAWAHGGFDAAGVADRHPPFEEAAVDGRGGAKRRRKSVK